MIETKIKRIAKVFTLLFTLAAAANFVSGIFGMAMSAMLYNTAGQAASMTIEELNAISVYGELLVTHKWLVMLCGLLSAAAAFVFAFCFFKARGFAKSFYAGEGIFTAEKGKKLRFISLFFIISRALDIVTTLVLAHFKIADTANILSSISSALIILLVLYVMSLIFDYAYEKENDTELLED